MGAYHIRENFKENYKEETQVDFERALKKGYFRATQSRLEEIKDVAKTIKSHWSGVLRWFDSKINNGILEGLNSLIKAATYLQRWDTPAKN